MKAMAAGAAIWSLGTGSAWAIDVVVDPNATFQTIDGFGGMQDRGWSGYNLLAADRNTLYGNGPGQLGFTIMRIRINESQSAWGNDLVDAKDVVSRGMKLFATAWSPPSSMRTPYSFTRNGTAYTSYKLNPSSYQAYADHLNSFAKYMKDNNAPLYALGFQNEPDWCGEWACGSPTEMHDFAKTQGAKLRANGNKVISAESFTFDKAYYDPMLNDPAAMEGVDILGTHFYERTPSTPDSVFDYKPFQQKGSGKPFWMTEVYTDQVNNQGSNAWPLCLDVAYEIHRALALSNMSAYMWWYLKRSYGPLHIASNNATAAASPGTVSKVGALMGQYSKYVRPGAVRVAATRVVQSDVYTSAFKKGDSLVVVSVNRATTAKTVSYQIPGLGSNLGKKVTTSGTKSLQEEPEVVVAGQTFTSTLDALSASTFVFVGLSGAGATTHSAVEPPPGDYEILDLAGVRRGTLHHLVGGDCGAETRTEIGRTGIFLIRSLDRAQPFKVFAP